MRDVNVLRANMEPFFDQKSENFVGFPQNQQETAEKWRDALGKYLAGIFPPSVSLQQSLDAFQATMLSITNENGLVNFPQAFVTQASIMATGMAPVYTATPPVGTPIFAPVYSLGAGGADNATCLFLLCTILDAWYSTGIAVQASTGTTINWQ